MTGMIIPENTRKIYKAYLKKFFYDLCKRAPGGKIQGQPAFDSPNFIFHYQEIDLMYNGKETTRNLGSAESIRL
jgi:hypothetical protein